MSARLEKFKSIARIRVDPVLAERWDFDMRSRGEVTIKGQIAQARRTATTLRKASLQFSKIRPEHELAINAAVSAMVALAKELEPMVAFAKAYKAFCDQEYKRERAEELESIANARWGSDAQALQFEADLVLELGTNEGKLSFGQWLHSIGEHTDVPLANISCCIGQLENGATLRERMALTIETEKRSTDNKWPGRDGLRVICSWRTYERYLAHRKEVAQTASGILKAFNV